MADNSTPQSSKTQIPKAKNDQSKLNFIQKVAVLAAFLVLLPLIPSQPPDFINQSLLSRSWELFQLVFVGIAVSYGLFSKKNDDVDNDNAKDHQSSNFDNAQSYVSKLLQVSSVFDDESAENPTLIDENKVQTWSSQYYREKPVVVVAEENPSLKEENTTNTSRFSQKPLLLPVRSLKYRVSEPDEVDSIVESSEKRNGSYHNRSRLNISGSRSFNSTTNPRKQGIEEELGGLNSQKMEENFSVLRSPVPWRSRSGRMEMKESGDGPPSNLVSPSMEGKELDFEESSRSLRSSDYTNTPPKSLSPPPSVSLPHKFSPSTSFSSSESQSKLCEDLTTKKKIVSSSPPPPPPPPPLFRKSMLTKSSSSALNNAVSSSKKEFTRSVKSIPQESMFEIKPEAEESPKRRSPGSELRPRSVRTFRTSGSSSSMEAKKDLINNDEPRSSGKDGYMDTTTNKKLFKDKEKDEAMEKVLIETSEEDSETDHNDGDDYDRSDCSRGVSQFNEVKNDDDSVGPDVDKKADEFIAKFREQIRLQRIESIRRSATQRAGKASTR